MGVINSGLTRMSCSRSLERHIHHSWMHHALIQCSIQAWVLSADRHLMLFVQRSKGKLMISLQMIKLLLLGIISNRCTQFVCLRYSLVTLEGKLSSIPTIVGFVNLLLVYMCSLLVIGDSLEHADILRRHLRLKSNWSHDWILHTSVTRLIVDSHPHTAASAAHATVKSSVKSSVILIHHEVTTIAELLSTCVSLWNGIHI